jgi:hypothetical protein
MAKLGCQRPSEHEEILRPSCRSFVFALWPVRDAYALNDIVESQLSLQTAKRRGDFERVRLGILLQVPNRIVTAP